MSEPSDDPVARGIAAVIAEAVEKHFWTIVGAASTAVVGWFAGLSVGADQLKGDIEKLRASLDATNKEVALLEAQGAQRRILLGCTVLTMQRVTDKLDIEQPCPMDLPQ